MELSPKEKTLKGKTEDTPFKSAIFLLPVTIIKSPLIKNSPALAKECDSKAKIAPL